MAERMIELHKKTGGATLTGPDGEEYTWPMDRPVAEVPYGWALELLAIPDGGFYVQGDAARGLTVTAERGTTMTAEQAGLGASVVRPAAPSEPPPDPEALTGGDGSGDDEDGDGDPEVTEPGPAAENAVTEPAPPPPNSASPGAERRRGATQTRAAGKRPAAKAAARK